MGELQVLCVAQDLLREFSRRLSGCCNSFDGFHVVWDRCPAAWNSEFFGKEGYPTIMYQIVVNHATWINSVTPGQQQIISQTLFFSRAEFN